VNLLPGAIWLLTAFSWISALVLIRAAHGAHIGALTERAIVATVLAVFGTVYSLVVLNAEVVKALGLDTAVTIVRVVVVFLLMLGPYWTFLYLTGRLGDDGKGGPLP